MSKVVYENESEILYSCASDNEDTEKTQEGMQEELEELESDIYYSLSDFNRVCGAVPELDDNLAMWDFINTMERISEELRESYTQYEDLKIKLRG